MNEPVLRCAVCHGVRITPATASCAGTESAKLKYKTPGGGMFDQGIHLPMGGRACIDCGFVMQFLSPEALEVARQQVHFEPWQF